MIDRKPNTREAKNRRKFLNISNHNIVPSFLVMKKADGGFNSFTTE